MPDRYWVGGTGTWNTTSTTNWSASSGGPNGASVPTAADNVFFNQAATYTVTMSGTAGSLSCNDFTVSAGVVTFAGSGAALLVVSGSLNTTSSTTWGGTAGNITFNSTTTGKTISTNGAAWSFALIFTGVGGGWSLGSAFSSPGGTQAITISAGTFSTNNYSITCPAITINGGTFNPGSSLITLSTSTAFTYTSGTFNAGTSDIRCSGTSPTFAGGSQTFNQVRFTSTNLNTASVSGANTFQDFLVTGRTSSGIGQVSFSANQTINGTLTLSAGTNATMRTFVRSDTIGTTRTLTCAAVAAPTDIDFRDITIAGAAAPVSGTRLSDCRGNSGITFPSAKTVYWITTGANNWAGALASSWALTQGGAFTHDAFPLAQDTAVFDNSRPGSGVTITINHSYNIGTIDMSARTGNTMTLATGSNQPTIYGNWINGTGTTLSGTGALTFAGRGSQTITSAGRTFTQQLTVETPSGSVSILDALTTSATFRLTNGTFNTNNYATTVTAFLPGNNTATRQLSLGSATLTINSSGAIWNYAGTNLTVTGTGTISLTSASAKTFAGGGIQTYPTLNQGGAGTLTVSGSNKFANITDTAIGRVQFTGGTTNIFDAFNLSGDVGNLLQLGSTNTTQAILQKSSAWLMGANSTDAGNNTGLSFTAGGGIDYLSVSYINGTVVNPAASTGNFFAFF